MAVGGQGQVMYELTARRKQGLQDSKLLHDPEGVRVHHETGALVLNDAGPSLEEHEVDTGEVEGVRGRQSDGAPSHDDGLEGAGFCVASHGRGAWLMMQESSHRADGSQ